jgi:hypothetical protein
MIEFLKISPSQMIKSLFYLRVFCELLFAWNVFFVSRAARTLCGSHRDTLALPNSQG